MPGVLTPFVGYEFRSGPCCNQHGDPYEWGCTIMSCGETAVIGLVDKLPSRDDREALRAALAEQEFTKAIGIRKRRGKRDRIAGPFEVIR